MRNKRVSAAVFAGLFAALLAAGTAKADSSITNIKLHFVDEVEEGQLSWPSEVIAPENGTYEIADVEEIEMAEEDYQPGDYIRFKVTLTPSKSSRYFYDGNDNRKYDFTADYSQAEALDSEVDEYGDLVIRVKYGPVIYKLTTPENVRFSETSPRTLLWDAVPEASGYEVDLMNGSETVKTISTGRATSCLLDGYGTELSGQYYARVRAVPVGTSQERYLYPSDYGFSATAIDGSALRLEGEWVENTDGWRYRLPDNRYFRGGWLLVDGSWYYFDKETGLMQTGWICPELGKWYYLDESGRWDPEA